MTTGIVDTTVIIHYYRKNLAARAWIDNQTQQLSVTSMTWLEVMRGAPSKAGQVACLSILNKFELLYLTQADQKWAMQELEKYRLSHGVGIYDCLIASIAHRLQVPLYTHNVKDMITLLDKQFVIKPYP